MNVNENYDVVIVGGGPVGASLACALAQRSPLAIAVIEAQSESPAWQANEYHYRVSAMTLASQRIFKALGVWDDIAHTRVSPFSRIEVWDEDETCQIQFCSRDIGETVLGFIIENNLIQQALQTKINHQHQSQITWLSPYRLASVCESENHIELHMSNGNKIIARLAIACDGAKSVLREQTGFKLNQRDYDQVAVVATVETEFDHDHTARQVFLKTGPLAFLPLAENKTSSIVWSLAKSVGDHVLSLNDKEFKEELAHSFSHRLGNVQSCSQRYAFPLQKLQADAYVKSRVVLVGDAAHTVHPLAGLGFNMGLLDVASLVEVISQAIKARRDFASVSTLRCYERWRRGDNFALMHGIDLIKTLFASEKQSLKVARSLGLNSTNRLPALRKFFTRFAVGNRVGLPQLAAVKAHE